ncbi:DUF4270 family protein [Flavobacterium sp. WC2421]|jgi:hypothetical protein|uniref:DUF4270 family protein n=3 Tax=unclassified Flavobacterium TaxID=196869 RepID=A0AB39WHE2_9FLAO
MYKLLLLLFLGAVITSCNSDVDTGEFVVGSDYLSVNNKVILIDTLTVDVSTINLDSLITSSQKRILVGNYDDPYFGKVKSDSYFQLSSSGYTLNTDNSDTDAPNYVFDSIRMILRPDKYYYGDTTKVQTISIHRLLQKVKPNVDDTNFYNDSSLDFDSESLGSVSFRPKPHSKDSVVVNIKDVFGDALFQKIKKREITNFDEFTEYFRGLVIKTTTSGSSSIVGFNTASVLRLYYSKYLGNSDESLVKDFNILDATKQFNNISLDRSGTLIKDLPVFTDHLSSLQTGNNAFIQSGTGLACRIDFPNIKQLKYISDKGAIVDAQLIIKPISNSYSDSYPLVDSLRVFVADKLNRISGTLNSTGSATYAILNTDADEFNENIGYKVSIGTFLQNEMIKKSDSRLSLILTLPSISKAVDRLLVGDQKNSNNKIQLKIYYISY